MFTALYKIKGFAFNGFSAGIKDDGALDLCIINAKNRADAAVTYIHNSSPSESDKVSTEQIANNKIQTVIINTDNANIGTGKFGKLAVHEQIKRAALTFKVSEDDIFIGSSGIVNKKFPTEKVINSITFAMEQLENTPDSSDAAARSIRTSGSVITSSSSIFNVDKNEIRIGGIAQYSNNDYRKIGSTHKIILTDFNIDGRLLKECLQSIIKKKENVATNDMVLILASGAAENTRIENSSDDQYQLFRNKLNEVYRGLLNH